MTTTVPRPTDAPSLPEPGPASPPRARRRPRWPVPPSLLIGIAPIVVFVVLSVIRARPSDDYESVGTTTESVVRALLIPEAISAGAMAIIVTGLGWWGMVAFDRRRGAPMWAALAPSLVVVVCLARLPFVTWGDRPASYFLLLALGTLLVGVFEEMLARGMLLVGLRRRLPEIWVWALSCTIFGLLHLINILAGAGVGVTIVQVVFAASFGSTLYIARRMSRTLAVPVLIHGLWDFGAIGATATGLPEGGALIGLGLIGLFSFAVLVFGIVAGVFVALRDDRPRRLAKRWATVPPLGALAVAHVGPRPAGWDVVPTVR